MRGCTPLNMLPGLARRDRLQSLCHPGKLYSDINVKVRRVCRQRIAKGLICIGTI